MGCPDNAIRGDDRLCTCGLRHEGDTTWDPELLQWSGNCVRKTPHIAVLGYGSFCCSGLRGSSKELANYVLENSAYDVTYELGINGAADIKRFDALILPDTDNQSEADKV